jgi:hypothetical protein
MEMGLAESAGGNVDKDPGVAVATPAAEGVPVTPTGLSGKEAQASVVSRIAKMAGEMGLAIGDEP